MSTDVLSTIPLVQKLTTGLKAAGVRTVLTSPTAIFNAYQSRQLEDMLSITDSGEALFNELKINDKFSLKTLIKASGDIFVSNYTELVGGDIIAPAVDKIAPIQILF